MFDGNVLTALYRPGYTWFPLLIVDFGTEVPINRIRFYPRLGRAEDARHIEQLDDPKPPPETFGEVSFSANSVPGYEILVADNTLKLDPCREGKPYLRPLRILQENLDVIVDLKFRTRSVRRLVLKVLPTQDWEIAEWEVYGEGFIRETEFITEILDFGKPVAWGKIGWQGQQPPETKVEIRTRTGNTASPLRYFDRDASGAIREITPEEYFADPYWRNFGLAPVDDAENWSFWSPPYDFDEGLRDTSCRVDCGREGTRLLSPSPSRYLQIALRFSSTFEAAPRLDELVLQFNESLAAQEVVGEIWPIEVESFEKERFQYIVRPIFQESDTGFDRLEIFTHTRVDTIRSIKLGGGEVDRNRFPAEIHDDRIVVSFPRWVGKEANAKQLVVVFEVEVLRYGAEFTGWVFDSADPLQVKQQVKPGNATYRFSGDVLTVKTPLGEPGLVDVAVAPNPFTPNGDGVNDAVRISYKIHDLTQERPVSLVVYDLAGRRVRAFPTTRGGIGRFHYEWDGRDEAGRLIPPGAYLFELSLDAEKIARTMGILYVVY